jgi:hypothetical protein
LSVDRVDVDTIRLSRSGGDRVTTAGAAPLALQGPARLGQPASEPGHSRLFVENGMQFHFEDQRRTARDGRRTPLVTVCEIGRTDELGFLADLHHSGNIGNICVAGLL